MALDVLLQAIAEDGEAEAQRILDAASTDAAAIRAAADARADQRCAEAIAARAAQLRAELETGRARRRNEARVEVLLARQRFLDSIVDEADRRLPGILDSAPPGALPGLCREALEFFPSGGARIRCRAGLARQLGETLGGVPIEVDESVAEGVIAESVDGAVRIDNTLRARLRRRRPELSIAILAAAQEAV